MSSESNKNKEYVNEGVIDVANEYENVYEQESIHEDTYVYDEESKKTSTTGTSVHKQKPGHQRGTPGLYDEIDYNLDTEIQDAPQIQNHENIPIDTKDVGGNSKKKKIIIGCVIGTLLIVAIAVGTVFAIPGLYILMLYFHLCQIEDNLKFQREA